MNNANDLLRLLDVLLVSNEPVEKRLQILKEDFGIVNSELEKDLREMTDLRQEIYEYGVAEGQIAGQTEEQRECAAESVKSLMKNLDIPFDKAIDLLGYDKDLRETCRRRLEQNEEKSADQK